MAGQHVLCVCVCVSVCGGRGLFPSCLRSTGSFGRPSAAASISSVEGNRVIASISGGIARRRVLGGDGWCPLAAARRCTPRPVYGRVRVPHCTAPRVMRSGPLTCLVLRVRCGVACGFLLLQCWPRRLSSTNCPVHRATNSSWQPSTCVYFTFPAAFPVIRIIYIGGN